MAAGMGRAEKSVGNGMTRMLKQASRTAVGIGAYFATIKIGQFLADPIKSAGNFQETMAVLRVQTGAGVEVIDKMSKRAIKLGADLRLPAVTASDAAEAMLELSKGGFSAQSIMESIRPVLLLGTAAQIDFAEAANVVTQTLTAFEIPATQAKAVVDLFAAAAVSSVADVSDITAAMTFCAQAFHAVGVPVKDATTAIAVMAQGGQKGSVAGATLAVAIQKLANPTEKAKTELKALGINVWDANGSFVGMRQAISIMSPVMDKMSDKQRLATQAILGGVRGQRALNILFGGGVEKWDAMTKAVSRHNMAQKLANARTEGFNGAMRGFISTIQTLSVTLGLKLLPKATEFMRFLQRVASAPNVAIGIKIVWEGVANVTTDLVNAINDAFFGHAGKQAILAHGAITIDQDAVAFEPGIMAKLQDELQKQIDGIQWGVVGQKISTAISNAILFSDKVNKAMNSLLNAALAWVNSHQGQIAEVGLKIGLTMVKTILDPGFWARNWQLVGGVILAVASTAFPAGKMAVIGERLAISAFSKFGSVLEPLVLKGFLALPPKIGSALATVAAKVGSELAKFVPIVIFWALAIADRFISRISRSFGRLGPLVKTLLYTGVVSVMGNLVAVVAGKAEDIAAAIANGIKTAPAKLAGLAGDLSGKIASVVSQVAGSAFTYARNVGFSIADGVISGVGNLAGRLKDKVVGAAKDAMAWGGRILHGSGDWMFTKHVVGIPMVQGIIDGIEAMSDKLAQAIGNTVRNGVTHGGEAVTKAGPKIKHAFDILADDIKNTMAAKFAAATATVEAAFLKAQTKLDVMKAKLTPAEAFLAKLQADAAVAAVEAAVVTAKAAMDKLEIDFQKSWDKLIADQAKNMKKLKDVQGATVTDRDIAGHQFDQQNQATANDPLAQNLLAARKNLDTIKLAYAAGTATMDQLFAAQDAYDAASLAATDDTNAQTLLSDYDTWQSLITQAAEGAIGIAEQEAADAEAQKTAQEEHNTAKKDAEETYQGAGMARLEFYLGQRAELERKKADIAYEDLSTALKKRHDRTILHIENVEKAWDKAYERWVKAAKLNGGAIATEFVDALDKMADPKGPLSDALEKIGKLVAKYLKLNSPAELGPLSDLDRWWTKFPSTLLSGMDTKLITNAVTGAINPQLHPDLTAAGRAAAGANAAASAGEGVKLEQHFHELRADISPLEIGQMGTFYLRNLPR